MFTNVVELVWNAYLSFATEGGGHGHGGGGDHKAMEEEKRTSNGDGALDSNEAKPKLYKRRDHRAINHLVVVEN